MESQDNAEQNKEKFKGTRIIDSEDGWISPAGIFYACTPEEHDEAASFLLNKNRTSIEKRLEWHIPYVDIDNEPHREILKSAGYALMSKRLMVEQNLPEEMSRKQLELLERSGVVFAPDSGRLNPNDYLEYSKILKNNDKLQELQTGRSFVSKGLKNFIENPNKTIHVYDERWDLIEVFDALTSDEAPEIVFERKDSRELQETWRQIELPSGNIAFVELSLLEHAFGNTEDSLKLISKKQLEKYLTEIKRSRYDRKFNLRGDLDILDLSSQRTPRSDLASQRKI